MSKAHQSDFPPAAEGDEPVLLERFARVTRGKGMTKLSDGESEQDNPLRKKAAFREEENDDGSEEDAKFSSVCCSVFDCDMPDLDEEPKAGVEEWKHKELEVFSSLNIRDGPFESLVSSVAMTTPCSDNSIVSSIVQNGWSYLPPELLREIAILLPDISDLARFRAVCLAWRSAVQPTAAPEPSCLPGLLLVDEGNSEDVSPLPFLSYSFSGSYADVREVGAPPGRICGTGHGWLVVLADSNPTVLKFSIFLWNPLTRHCIDLPSSSSFITLNNAYDLEYTYHYSIGAISLPQGSDSPGSGCVVIMTCRKHRGFSFCRNRKEEHDEEWTTVESLCHDIPFISFAYHQGTILALHRTGEVLMVDIASLSRTRVAPHSSYKVLSSGRYVMPRIVETSSEVLLAIYASDTKAVFVFRLDLTAQLPRWCLTKDIGNGILFFDFNQLQCVRLQSRAKLNLKKNSIYRLARARARPGTGFSTYLICRYQLKNGTVEELPLSISRRSPFDSPMWFLPSLI